MNASKLAHSLLRMTTLKGLSLFSPSNGLFWSYSVFSFITVSKHCSWPKLVLFELSALNLPSFLTQKSALLLMNVIRWCPSVDGGRYHSHQDFVWSLFFWPKYYMLCFAQTELTDLQSKITVLVRYQKHQYYQLLYFKLSFSIMSLYTIHEILYMTGQDKSCEFLLFLNMNGSLLLWHQTDEG